MTTKHTPGPWELQAGRTISTTSGRFFLSYGCDKDTGAPHFQNFVELSENAKLIAAAPDLLEALEHAWGNLYQAIDVISRARQQMYQDTRPTDLHVIDLETCRNAVNRARAAIAKAKGGVA